MEIPREEPLARELADFVSAARARTQPLVDGAAGRKALALAVQVATAIGAPTA
jgi:predicted dehydrogenase